MTALGATGSALGATRTDGDGQFSLALRRPVWIRVNASGYRPRVRACAPGPSNRIVVSKAAGSAALAFGGDTMFARRFYTQSTDPLNPRVRIDPTNRRADHDDILAPVKPALAAADLTSVNLETPLTTRSLRHPTKRFAFASHPVAAKALSAAGVDYAALGNNHAFDALGPGLEDTIDALETAGIGHSGAGSSPEAAWEPHIQQAGDLDVAFVSCTTIDGRQYEIDWAANGPTERPTTVTIDGQQRTIAARSGVARATAERLRDAIQRGKAAADVVVVQIHGGEPYQPSPTEETRRLTETAAVAGADLIVNHHPHVVGGIERIEGALVAWSLGNFIFDQKIWSTFPSYMLTVTLTADGVTRANIDPILLDGFVPKGVIGKPNRKITWQTLGASSEMTTVTRSGLALGAGTESTRTETKQFTEQNTMYGREVGWVSDVLAGSVRLGRDLLPTGEFESINVDSQGYDGTLWRYGRTYPTVSVGYGLSGSGGVELRRVDGNRSRAVLSNSRRIPVEGPVTVTSGYRTDNEGLTGELTWFEGTSGPAIDRQVWDLRPTDGDWQRFSQDFSLPDDATHANVLFALEPGSLGRRTSELDDIRLIEWADQRTSKGREFDHFRMSQPATIEFEVPKYAEEAVWRRVD
nr:CapA family protein [Haloarcula argentinensis]